MASRHCSLLDLWEKWMPEPAPGRYGSKISFYSNNLNKESSMVRASDIMTRNLAFIDQRESAYAASILMRILKIGSVLVKHDNQIIGIVTEADLARRVISMNRVPEYTPVSSVMSSPLIGIEYDRPIWEVADHMQQAGTRHLAVTKSQDIIGIVSVRDLLRPVAVDAL